MSPALNGNTVLQCFKHGNAVGNMVEIRDCHMYMYNISLNTAVNYMDMYSGIASAYHAKVDLFTHSALVCFSVRLPFVSRGWGTWRFWPFTRGMITGAQQGGGRGNPACV